MDATRAQLWTAGWSRKKCAAVFALGLLMFYLHSLYILGFYVSEDEYWWPVWTGMTLQQRLLSHALALFANLSLLVMPFLRAPGGSMRAVLALSLTFGLVISIAWLARDLWTFGLLNIGSIPTTGHIGIFLGDIILLVSPLLLRGLFATAIFLESWFLFTLVKRP